MGLDLDQNAWHSDFFFKKLIMKTTNDKKACKITQLAK